MNLGEGRARQALVLGSRELALRIRQLVSSTREILDVSERTAWVVVLGAPGAVAAYVSIAAGLGVLLQATGLALALLLVLLSLRWPLLPLFAFAALIPIEEVTLFADLGTLSKVAGILFAVAYAVPRLGRLTLRAMPLPAWAYVGWAALSLGWALEPGASLAELPTLIMLFAVGILVADVVVHRPTVVRHVLWVYSLSAAATALLGITAYFTGQGPGDRVVGLQSQDPNLFAANLLPALVFGVYEVLEGRLAFGSGAVAVVSALGILLSGSRGAWLSVAVVLALFILPRLRAVQRMAAISGTLVLLVVSLQLPGVAELVLERTSIAFSTGGAGRTDIWSVGITIYKSAPVVGVGFANYPIAYTPERIRASEVGAYSANSLSGQSSHQGTATDPTARVAHNIVLSALAELGLVGLVLLALFLMPLVLRRGWGPDAAVVQAVLASLLVAALFLDVINGRKEIWLILGLAAGLAHLASRQTASRTEPVPLLAEAPLKTSRGIPAWPTPSTTEPGVIGYRTRSRG